MVFKFLRPDSISAWKNEKILKRFPRYKDIIDGNQISRYIISKSIKCDFDSKSDSLESLENLLSKKTNEFNELIKKDIDDLKNRKIQTPSLIDLSKTIAYKYLEKCNFCERKCGVNRLKGEKGYCLLTKDSYISSAFLHMGEESVLIPSGTIFFLGCNFGCVFCQNFDISQTWKGRKDPDDIARKVSSLELAQLAERLVKEGAININYVGGDPVPNIHTIIDSLNYQTSNITQLWNSNLFLTDNALSLLINFIDFWLPDFKFSTECAHKYSGVQNYFEIITRNLKRIHDEGSGEIIIRHLVMPNHIECCSKPILNYIAEEIPKCVVNIMGQFRPEFKANKYPKICRRPTSEEMQSVKSYADKLGILWRPIS